MPARCKPFFIASSAGDDGPYARGYEELEAEQAHGTGAGDERRIAEADGRPFFDRLHGGGKGLAHSGFFKAERGRYLVDLVGAQQHIACECAVDAVAHSTAAGTEDEVALAAIFAFPAGDSGGTQAGDAIADGDGFDFGSDFDHGA